MGVSSFDVDCNEEAVVDRVKQRIAVVAEVERLRPVVEAAKLWAWAYKKCGADAQEFCDNLIQVVERLETEGRND